MYEFSMYAGLTLTAVEGVLNVDRIDRWGDHTEWDLASTHALSSEATQGLCDDYCCRRAILWMSCRGSSVKCFRNDAAPGGEQRNLMKLGEYDLASHVNN